MTNDLMKKVGELLELGGLSEETVKAVTEKLAAEKVELVEEASELIEDEAPEVASSTDTEVQKPTAVTAAAIVEDKELFPKATEYSFEGSIIDRICCRKETTICNDIYAILHPFYIVLKFMVFHVI